MLEEVETVYDAAKLGRLWLCFPLKTRSFPLQRLQGTNIHSPYGDYWKVDALEILEEGRVL